MNASRWAGHVQLGGVESPDMKQAPLVDDTDVDRMINFMFGKSVNTTIAPEERAEAAY